jgi:hypothetical protein
LSYSSSAGRCSLTAAPAVLPGCGFFGNALPFFGIT